MDDVPAVFTHDNPAPGGRADVVTTRNDIRIAMSQFTAAVTYGLTDSLDVSVGIPIVSTDLSVTSLATIQRLGTTGNELVHFFDDGSGGTGARQQFRSSASATGLGDILVRMKGTVARWNGPALAGGVDVRLPTGDEENLLGAGTLGLKPFVAISFLLDRYSPHVNAGYQWNGESVLAGDVVGGAKADLADQFVYVVGMDAGVSDALTVALDLVGQRVSNSSRFSVGTFTGLDAHGTQFSTLHIDQGSIHPLSAAVGFKVNGGSNLLVDFNLLLALNDVGLRDKVTPLFGFEYSF